jgi:hypothetical protein
MLFKGYSYLIRVFFLLTTLTWNLEKLYEIEHPKHTTLFDELSVIDEDEIGYWISKKWCKGLLFYFSAQLLQLTPKKIGN